MQNLTKKKVFVYSLLIILILLAGYILLRIENHSLQSKEEAQLQLKMDAVSEVRLSMTCGLKQKTPQRKESVWMSPL